MNRVSYKAVAVLLQVCYEDADDCLCLYGQHDKKHTHENAIVASPVQGKAQK